MVIKEDMDRIKDDRGFKDKLKGAALELYRNAFNLIHF